LRFTVTFSGMDLAVYINELLGLQGKVNLPGIGHFVQVRVNGYFSESENKFYPPTHKVTFLAQPDEDEHLAKYIAGKKNISLASSKYFVDKYAAGLRQQLVLGRAEVSGLGYLYADGAALKFSSAADQQSSDPAFYGFAPVSVAAPEQPQPAPYEPPAVIKEEVKPAAQPPPAPVQPEEMNIASTEDLSTPTEPNAETLAPEAEEYEYEEPQPQRQRNPLVIWLLIIVIVILAVLGLYKYKPDWFIFSGDKPQTYIAVSDTLKPAGLDSAKVPVKQDTAAKMPAEGPSAAKGTTINAPVDTFGVLRYEILGGAFETSEQAEAVIKSYQKRGLQPRIIQHTSARLHIITLGTYFDHQLAQKAYDSILSATKINKEDIYLQTYKPKK
jgi:hypothetical protein